MHILQETSDVYLLVCLSFGGRLRNRSMVKSLLKHIVLSVMPKSSSRGVRASSSIIREHFGVFGWDSCIIMRSSDGGVRATAGAKPWNVSELPSTICRWSADRPKSESCGVRIGSTAGGAIFSGVLHSGASTGSSSSPAISTDSSPSGSPSTEHLASASPSRNQDKIYTCKNYTLGCQFNKRT